MEGQGKEWERRGDVVIYLYGAGAAGALFRDTVPCVQSAAGADMIRHDLEFNSTAIYHLPSEPKL